MIKFWNMFYENYRVRITSSNNNWDVIFSIDRFDSSEEYKWTYWNFYFPLFSKLKLKTFFPLTLKEIEDFLKDFEWEWNEVLDSLHEFRIQKESNDDLIDLLDDPSYFEKNSEIFMRNVWKDIYLFNENWEKLTHFWINNDDSTVFKVSENLITFRDNEWNLNLIDLKTSEIKDTLKWFIRVNHTNLVNSKKFFLVFSWIVKWEEVTLKDWDFNTIFHKEWDYIYSTIILTHYDRDTWKNFHIIFLDKKDEDIEFFIVYENWNSKQIFKWWNNEDLYKQDISLVKKFDNEDTVWSLYHWDFIYIKWVWKTIVLNTNNWKELELNINPFSVNIQFFENSKWDKYLSVLHRDKKIYIYDSDFNLLDSFDTKEDWIWTIVLNDNWNLYKVKVTWYGYYEKEKFLMNIW